MFPLSLTFTGFSSCQAFHIRALVTAKISQGTGEPGSPNKDWCLGTWAPLLQPPPKPFTQEKNRSLPQQELHQPLLKTPSSDRGMTLRKTFTPTFKQCFHSLSSPANNHAAAKRHFLPDHHQQQQLSSLVGPRAPCWLSPWVSAPAVSLIPLPLPSPTALASGEGKGGNVGG